MTTNETTIHSYLPARGFRLPAAQVALMFAILGVGNLVCVVTVPQTLPTLLLLWFVAFWGLVLCRRTQMRLGDPSLKVLGYFWLIKLGVTFFLLYAAWIPNLDYYLVHGTGYDPTRYYWQAQELVRSGWVPDFVSLNYVGILYYYGAVFALFGHNPLAPALVNVLVTLITTLFLIRTCYEINPRRSGRDWLIGYALLIPEILWFDIMTAKEVLVGALIVIGMLGVGRYLSDTSSVSLSKIVMIAGMSAPCIAAVRTSMIVPFVGGIGLMLLLVKPQRRRRTIGKTFLWALVVIAFFAAPIIATNLGGYDYDVVEKLSRATNAAENIATSDKMSWSENSIGLQLMPNSVMQSILYLPPRMLLYLVAPLPNVGLSLNGLLGADYVQWQRLFAAMTSVINIILYPYALASLYRSIRTRRKSRAPLMLHIAYWMIFVGIVGGNLIVQVRYRIMATLLLTGCAWLGARTCGKSLIRETSILWYGVLIAGALFYVGYKFL